MESSFAWIISSSVAVAPRGAATTWDSTLARFAGCAAACWGAALAGAWDVEEVTVAAVAADGWVGATALAGAAGAVWAAGAVCAAGAGLAADAAVCAKGIPTNARDKNEIRICLYMKSLIDLNVVKAY